jgi:hypothetical protein
MNAEQARHLSNKANLQEVDPILDYIYDAIRKTANKGDYNLYYVVDPDVPLNSIDAIIKRLIENGFKAELRECVIKRLIENGFYSELIGSELDNDVKRIRISWQ